MNEYIEVKFYRNGKWLKLKREVPGYGIELDETDPIARSVYIGISSSNQITRYRMRRLRQVKGWEPGVFKLSPSVEGGVLVLRGVDKESLPEGRYELRIGLEEAKVKQPKRTVDVPHDGNGEFRVDVTLDDRSVICRAADDPEISRVIGASVFDAQPAAEWIDDTRWRATKKACFLNLLASLRIKPAQTTPLIKHVEAFFWMSNDRGYARVHRDLFTTLEALASDEDRPFYREGRPHADVHLRLLDEVPEDERHLFNADSLVSFRGEGSPSLQTVIATPPTGFAHTYAEFDLDMGNPLQDLEGFVVHLIELADGKPTNHLDLRKDLAKKADKFLYYNIA